jgi:VWFA-related protein
MTRGKKEGLTGSFVAFCLALSFAGLAAEAQRSADSEPNTLSQPQPGAMTLHVRSRLTLVDVTVTDSKGHVVHGLKQSDFTILEDGKPQSIRSFQEVGTDPPDASSTITPRNILLLDGLNTAPADAMKVEQVSAATGDQFWMQSEAKKYLKVMPTGTQVAILDMGKTTEVLQDFTSDPELLSAAADKMDVNLDGVGMSREMMCAQQHSRNEMTLDSLNRIASSMSGVEGRKNLVWLTRGIPSITESGASGCLPNYGADLHKAYNLLAAAQVAVYPVGLDLGLGVGTMSMDSVAEATGGVAHYNSNDVAAGIASAIEDGSHYYSISYTPPSIASEGRHHTIRVNLDRPRMHLVYRNGYYEDIAKDVKRAKPTANPKLR